MYAVLLKSVGACGIVDRALDSRSTSLRFDSLCRAYICKSVVQTSYMMLPLLITSSSDGCLADKNCD